MAARLKGMQRTTITVHGRLPGGFALQRGDEPVCSPRGRPLVLAKRSLAEAVAQEEAAPGGFALEALTLYSMACSETDFVQAPHGNGREIREEMARVHLPGECTTALYLHPPELVRLGPWLMAWRSLVGAVPSLKLPPFGSEIDLQSVWPEALLERTAEQLAETPDAVITAMLNGMHNGLSCTAPYLLHASPDPMDFLSACSAWAESPLWGSEEGILDRAGVLLRYVQGGGAWSPGTGRQNARK